MDPKWARLWFTATAAIVAVGVLTDVVLAWQNPTRALPDGGAAETFGGSPLNRSLNILAYFTVQSNLIVGVTSLLLAVGLTRYALWFRVLRLIGLIAITVTFVVFHIALRGLLDLHSWARFSNLLVHTVVPVMAIVGWLAFGPRGITSARVAQLTLVFPLGYMAFTVIRGPLASDWYPYPFADVKALGYLPVIVNGLWIGLLFVALSAGATWLDSRLAEAHSGAPRPG